MRRLLFFDQLMPISSAMRVVGASLTFLPSCKGDQLQRFSCRRLYCHIVRVKVVLPMDFFVGQSTPL
jgi:hypothetical protein